MSRTVSYHPQALEEIDEALLYYDGKGDELAEGLATELEATYALIRRNPAQYREHEPDIRKMKTRPRFSYYVFFTFDDVSITILGVRHTSRDEMSLQDRLPERDEDE